MSLWSRVRAAVRGFQRKPHSPKRIKQSIPTASTIAPRPDKWKRWPTHMAGTWQEILLVLSDGSELTAKEIDYRVSTTTTRLYLRTMTDDGVLSHQDVPFRYKLTSRGFAQLDYVTRTSEKQMWEDLQKEREQC